MFSLAGQSCNGAYSNPCKQVGTQNKDFGAVLQTDFFKSLVPSVRQAFLLWRVVGRARYNSPTPAWEAIARSQDQEPITLSLQVIQF